MKPGSFVHLFAGLLSLQTVSAAHLELFPTNDCSGDGGRLFSIWENTCAGGLPAFSSFRIVRAVYNPDETIAVWETDDSVGAPAAACVNGYVNETAPACHAVRRKGRTICISPDACPANTRLDLRRAV